MLKDIRLAIFDFDDTLAIHKNSDYVKTRGKDDDEYFLEAFINPEIFYESIEPCEPSKDMMDLIYYCMMTVTVLENVHHLKYQQNMDIQL